MTKQEQFFYDNAGYSHAPTQTPEEGHVETAKALARAETWSVQEGHYTVIEHDDDADASWIDNEHDRETYLANVWYMQLWSEDDKLLGSLGSCDGGHKYKRVVRAELALEAMPKGVTA